jgi:hypothetical protein
MSIEILWNKYTEGDWWFELGIGYSKTEYHPRYKRVFTVALGIASVYFRW